MQNKQGVKSRHQGNGGVLKTWHQGEKFRGKELILLLLLILIAKMSAMNRYSNTEMVHPCRIPLDISQLFDNQPLFFILNIGFV